MRILFVAGVVTLMAAVGCSDSTDGGPGGSPSLSGTVDGAMWVADTAVSILRSDSSLMVAGARRVSTDETQSIVILVRGFTRAGQFQLADSSTPALGLFGIARASGGPLGVQSTYWSTGQQPGSLTISSFTVTDSVVAGTFSFEAVAHPDTARHHRVSGRFRVPYDFQVVYSGQ